MGFFFSNLHVRRSEDYSQISFQTALAELLKEQGYIPAADPDIADLSVYVFDGGGAWVSVCADGIDFYTEESIQGICKPLSDRLAVDVLTISCFDSDCLLLNRLNSRQGTDACAKVGIYPGLRRRPTPARWKGLVDDFSRWNAVLKKDYVFAEDSLESLEPLLGLMPGQGSFCAELVSAEVFVGNTQTLYFSVPETVHKPEPPLLTIPAYDLMPCEMGKNSMICAVNTGGKSRGLAVAFSGSYVEHEEIRFRDVQIEYAFDRHPRPTIPLQLEKRLTQNGQWIYYAEVPQFQILPGVREGLPLRRAMEEQFKREFGLRFTPEGNERKRLDITLHFIPLQNPAGQCGWCVWLYSGSKRAFIEDYNRTWSDRPINAPKSLNADDFDMEDSP